MKTPLEIKPELTPHAMALRLALAYLLWGGLWILFSDRLLGGLGLPIGVERAIASGKGLGFVAATALGLYALSRVALTRVRAVQVELAKQEQAIRQAYVEVLDAVTGGRLVLLTAAEMDALLGAPLGLPRGIEDPSQLCEARAMLRRNAGDMLSPEVLAAAVSAMGEALNNALTHAGSGTYEVRLGEEVVQVVVGDEGPGIDFRSLPRAALVPGFSTTQTLGMGFTLMLQLADRVLICTSEDGTRVVLEFSTARG